MRATRAQISLRMRRLIWVIIVRCPLKESLDTVYRLASASSDQIFILIILFDNPLKYNQSNIMTGH